MQILADLKALNLKSISAPNGERYSITRKPTFDISNPAALEKWATENRLISINNEMVKSKLKILFASGDMPDFVTVGESETITIVKPKAKGAEAESEEATPEA